LFNASSFYKTLLAIPYWKASSAVIPSPKNSISLAFFCDEIVLTSYTPGVEQKSPHFMPGQLKLEDFVAISISHPMAN
jgi:hypothetical protein